ncbi:MAG: hypothetical protein ACYSW3_02265 [Planctomycetota bacterium]|jgi:hypothetical protein
MSYASVHDSYYPIRTSVDIPYTDDYDPGAYEYNTPYLSPEEIGDVHAQSQDQWDIEVQAYEEDWDSYPDFQPPSVFRGMSKPAPNVDYAEANHLYISAGTLALIEMMRYAARKVNYNPPKKRMSTTVPVHKKEVPVNPPQQPLIPIEKKVGINRKLKRIPARELPLWQYRGWKELQQ